MWVVLSISLFVLVVFGSALFLYSPSKFQSPNVPQDFAYIKEASDPNSKVGKVDPDLWSRQGETVPGFRASDEEMDDVKNITVIDGSDVEDGQKYIDISPSVSDDKDKRGKTKKLPEEVAKELGATYSEKGVREVVGTGRRASTSSDENLDVSFTNRSYKVQKETKERTAVGNNKKDARERAGTFSQYDDQEPKEKKRFGREVAPSQPKKPSVQEKQPVQKPSIETVYWVQTASLSSRLNAEKAREKLAQRHMKVQIFTRDQSAGLTHRVRVGPFSNKTEAEYWLKNIKDIQGFEQSYISEERVRV